MDIPPELEKQVNVINFPEMEEDEVSKRLDFIIESASAYNDSDSILVTPDERKEMVELALGNGFTSYEVEDFFSLCMVRKGDPIQTIFKKFLKRS